jgi:hypothetical protein
MGTGQSTGPKVTAQDRAILECVLPSTNPVQSLIRSIQPQAAARQGQAVPAQGSLRHRMHVSPPDAAAAQIQTILDRERQLAKDALAAGNKERALLALRRRKYQEQVLVKTDSQLETLQGLVRRRPDRTCASEADDGCQVNSIEFSLVEKDVLFGLRQGNAVLKELNTQLSVDNVEKLMDETADAVAYQRARRLTARCWALC